MGTAVHLAVAGGVFDCVFLAVLFSIWMSWMRSGTLLSQFLRDFLPTLQFSIVIFPFLSSIIFRHLHTEKKSLVGLLCYSFYIYQNVDRGKLLVSKLSQGYHRGTNCTNSNKVLREIP